MLGVVSPPWLYLPPKIDSLHRRLDFTHDHARSRAYRWGEDGIAGVCDTHGYQNISFAFWNEKEYARSPFIDIL